VVSKSNFSTLHQIKETPYVKLFHEVGIELVTAQWLPSTTNMEDNDVKEQFQILAEIVSIYHPKKWIADLRQFLVILSPEVQEWTDQKIAPFFHKYGLKKMVMLVPEEFTFEKVAVEQLTEEKTFMIAWQTRFYTDEAEARKWLLI